MKFIAFLDVLGFKEMVEKSTHEKLEKVYSNLFVSNAAYSISGGNFITVDSPTGSYATADLSKPLTSCLIVSDSVMLWTEDTSMKSFLNICAAVGKLLVSGVYTGLPMRGGIAMGEISHLKSSPNTPQAFGIQTIFGKGLVRAYTEESSHEWMGCVITDDCVNAYIEASKHHIGKIQDLATIEHLVKMKFLLRYPAPRKDNKTIDRWIINWPIFNNSPTNETTVSKAFTMHTKNLEHPTSKIKLDNTLEFLRYSQVL